VKTLKLLLAAVLAYCFIQFVFPLLFLVVGFALSESEEVIRSSESPDGEYVAELYRFSGGAAISKFEYYLTLREKGEKPDMRKKRIAKSRHEFSFAWNGPEELVVTANAHDQLSGKETYKKAVIRYVADIPIWAGSMREVYPAAEAAAYGLGGKGIGLADVTVTFRGQEAIKSRKGETRYEFHGWDSDNSAWIYIVTIDGGRNAVVGAERKPRYERFRSIEIWTWPDTRDFFRVLEEQAGLEKIIGEYANPVMIIRPDNERCEIVIGEAMNPDGTGTQIFIDSATGRIVQSVAKQR
jgi:hypothetical protein